MDILKGKPMREKLIPVTVFVALLLTVGFLSYQVYERDEAIHNLQLSVLKTEIVLGMCQKTNRGLKENIQSQPWSITNIAAYLSEN